MKIALVTPLSEPALKGMVTGNNVTAGRWVEMLRKLGHDVTVLEAYDGEAVDALIALHARKSAVSIAKFAETHPNKPVIVALTGTDLYQDLPDSKEAKLSLARATHVITLQPGALEVLDPSIRAKTTVIYQSAKPILPAIDKAANCFQAALLAHLRPVKNPLLAADAAVKLPPDSQVRIVHAGAAADDEMRDKITAATAENPRYRWIGPIPHQEARLLIARSHVLLLTSRLEGGANVLSEALALGVPILASRVPGIEGLLGKDYPGYFPPADASGLAERLHQAQRDEVYYRRLQIACEKLAPMVAPARELQSWQQLLSSLT
ncbi:MAG: hypothetical protein BMS9Abin37_0336 [Acidobacteriota bacterium]|nr:MAG: hypothetical protein BMS9Abin37_0336 [Acidobacteriota bacterium]